MECTNYYDGMLVIAKHGNNPWWPGQVIRCVKSNKCVQEIDMNTMVYVNFLEINIETWINKHNIIRLPSREKMNCYLDEKRSADSGNVKYINNIPQTMEQSYEKAWNKYNKMIKKHANIVGQEEDDTEMIVDLNPTKLEKTNPEDSGWICEVCVNVNIEFEFGSKNAALVSLSEIDRSRLLSPLMIVAENEMRQCENRCVWKYHSRCVTSEADLVCCCNKSAWLCSICNEDVSVAQLFMCNNHECMRAYHKSCLSAHFELQADTKECPLHQCINCHLDCLVPQQNADTKPVSLTYCVKCKLGFHNHIDCLPASFVTISDKYIICGRHLVDVNILCNLSASLCFCCGSVISDPSLQVSCKYCQVTYHNTAQCLPSWLDSQLDQHFICNGCKFPLARRWRYLVLARPGGEADLGNIHQWRVGAIYRPSTDCRTVAMLDTRTNNTHSVLLSHVIPINLQSIDHFLCFGRLRFNDMQAALRHLSATVGEVRIALGLRQTYTRNGFVLNFSGLFPVVGNLDGGPRFPSETASVCACTDCCSTTRCPNVAARAECTDTICGLPAARCRNRRLQKARFPRQRLEVEGSEEPRLILEEPVVKNVLVTELVGQCLFPASTATITIDNSLFCNISRFATHGDAPNLVAETWTVAGARRIGLFSSRRILAGEILTVANDDRDRPALLSWAETTKKPPVTPLIDLCEDRDSTPASEMRPRRPLCPLCLEDLEPDLAGGPLLHCLCCYSVHHLKCAAAALTAHRQRLYRPERDRRIMRFVCRLCRPLDD